MSSPSLSFALDLTNASVSQRANDLGLDYTSDGTLTLTSGLEVSYGLGIGSFSDSSYELGKVQDANGGIAPKSLTTVVYSGLHLVAGEKLKINARFTPGDFNYKDEAIALLQDSNGDISPGKIANTQDVIDNNGNEYYQLTYTINQSGSYNLLLGAGDVGDSNGHSVLQINSIATSVDSYTITQNGVMLPDGTTLRSDGSELVGGSVVPGVLSGGAPSLIAGLVDLLKAGVISNDGGSLITNDGGSLITNDGATLLSQDGGGLSGKQASLITNDGATLITNDGASLKGSLSAASLAALQADLASSNAFQGRSYKALSLNGDAGPTNYGVGGSSQALPTGSVSSTPVPGLEVNASGGAVQGHNTQQGAIAALGGGKYVVAFAEYGPGPNNTRTYAIRAQVVANGPSGGVVGQEFAFGTGEANGPMLLAPSVASLGNGAFVVAWADSQHVRPEGAGFVTGSDLYAQVVHADGSVGSKFQLNAPIASDSEQDTDVSVAGLSDGGFVAVWASRPGYSSSNLASIKGQVYNADGSARGSGFTLSGTTSFKVAGVTLKADFTSPSVTATANGGFAVAFAGQAANPFSPSQSVYGIAAQTFDASGSATARNPSVVALSPADPTSGAAGDRLGTPSIATLANGNVAVAWLDTPDQGRSGVYTQVLDPSLKAVGSPALVAGNDQGFYGHPGLTALPDGRFAVAWTDTGFDGTYSSLGQLLNPDNTLSGASFNVYAPGGGDGEVAPALAALPDGTLVATTTHVFNALSASDQRSLPIAVGGGSSLPPVGTAGVFDVGGAYHGYVSGATVFADANGNGVLDSGESAAKTTSAGAFALRAHAKGPLVLTGGTDLASGLAFKGRYLAPEGSSAVNATTTVIQDIVAAGSDVGTAQMKVATALGLSADTALTQIDPVVAASQGGATGRAAAVANSVLADVSDLATAAGGSDPLAAFAKAIGGAAGFTSFDPSSSAALAATGLKGQVLADVSSIASAVKALVASKAAGDAGDPTKLMADLDRAEYVVQTGAMPALTAAVAAGMTAAVAAAYTGAALEAKVAAATPPSLITAKTVGVYRFFDTKFGTHFFTASSDERDAIIKTRADLKDEGVGLTAVDPASNDPNAAPVYRFFDTKFGTHFFTASASERDQVMAARPDLKFEGTGFYEHTAQQAGDTAVYRFFDTKFGTHFYTGDAGERANIISTRPDLKDEGIGFYAPKASTGLV